MKLTSQNFHYIQILGPSFLKQQLSCTGIQLPGWVYSISRGERRHDLKTGMSISLRDGRLMLRSRLCLLQLDDLGFIKHVSSSGLHFAHLQKGNDICPHRLIVGIK